MKHLVVFILLIGSSPAWGKQIVLDRQFKSGSRLVDILKYEKGQYYLQGKSLGKELPPPVRRAWAQIESYKTSPKKLNCSAGEFRLTTKDGKKSSVRSGCAQGKEYAALVKNLNTLRKHSETVKK